MCHPQRWTLAWLSEPRSPKRSRLSFTERKEGMLLLELLLKEIFTWHTYREPLEFWERVPEPDSSKMRNQERNGTHI